MRRRRMCYRGNPSGRPANAGPGSRLIQRAEPVVGDRRPARRSGGRWSIDRAARDNTAGGTLGQTAPRRRIPAWLTHRMTKPLHVMNGLQVSGVTNKSTNQECALRRFRLVKTGAATHLFRMRIRKVRAIIGAGLFTGWALAASAMDVASENAFDHEHAGWADLLIRVVDEAGRVDYAALQADPSALHAYLRTLARVDNETYRAWTPHQQLAYLINLYNAQTVDLIIRHYPLDSIKDIGTLWRGPWGQPVVSLFGKITTLDNLEHKIIRPLFAEPRTHFALVAAARSAPPLRREPYRADRLEAQLQDQARRFLLDPTRNTLNIDAASVELSMVFKWFSGDFEESAGSVEAYVLALLDDAGRERLAGRRLLIRFRDYDWSLNDSR